MNNLNLLNYIFAGVLSLSVIVSVPAYAANPSIPAASDKYGLDITMCYSEFDWATKIADTNAGRTQSEPYIDFGCVSQTNVYVDDNRDGVFQANEIKVPNYRDFNRGSAVVRTEAAAYPVLGLFPNQGRPAQSIPGVTPVNLAETRNLRTVFSTEQMNELCFQGNCTAGTGLVFSTGPDQFRRNQDGSVMTNAQGQRTYQGGWCTVENGQLKVRDTRAGEQYIVPADRAVATPNTSCARTVNGTRLPAVEQTNMQVYQFIKTRRYPTAQECAAWFNIDGPSCNTFFQEKYGKNLAGDTDFTRGTEVVRIRTFLGAFDHRYSKWVGWANTNLNSPYTQSPEGYVRTYDGTSVYEF